MQSKSSLNPFLTTLFMAGSAWCLLSLFTTTQTMTTFTTSLIRPEAIYANSKRGITITPRYGNKHNTRGLTPLRGDFLGTE